MIKLKKEHSKHRDTSSSRSEKKKKKKHKKSKKEKKHKNTSRRKSKDRSKSRVSFHEGDKSPNFTHEGVRYSVVTGEKSETHKKRSLHEPHTPVPRKSLIRLEEKKKRPSGSLTPQHPRKSVIQVNGNEIVVKNPSNLAMQDKSALSVLTYDEKKRRPSFTFT